MLNISQYGEINMASEWYSLINGKPEGPYSAQSIRLMVARGELAPTDLVREGGAENKWVRVATLSNNSLPIKSVSENVSAITSSADKKTFHYLFYILNIFLLCICFYFNYKVNVFQNILSLSSDTSTKKISDFEEKLQKSIQAWNKKTLEISESNTQIKAESKLRNEEIKLLEKDLENERDLVNETNKKLVAIEKIAALKKEEEFKNKKDLENFEENKKEIALENNLILRKTRSERADLNIKEAKLLVGSSSRRAFDRAFNLLIDVNSNNGNIEITRGSFGSSSSSNEVKRMLLDILRVGGDFIPPGRRTTLQETWDIALKNKQNE
ncbi:MAG: GYF domain-containing protein [Chryseobacterium sp.]